ncbi:response regulator [Roseateles violae]|uniref:Response regulator n=1 Tax=Roseateles violae TaxID=3058042 RepID=A0ABT8DUP8_9BURK|nr:HD domain-containing phosphohydrolase [Pelomonas sp. PFR6]MDN3920760.1 response regulator [Pelomonas sp. PFR6]
MSKTSPQSAFDTAAKPTVLVVDDVAENLLVLGEALHTEYEVRVANCGEQGLAAASMTPPPALILLDIMMPDLDGFEVLKRLRADERTQGIPVIFITAMNSVMDEQQGLSLGAVDYVSKPFNAAVVLARVRTHIELKIARDRLADNNRWLEQEVQRRLHQSLLVQDLSLRALACLAEARDNETGHHILRTQRYVEILATGLREHPRYAAALAGPRLAMIVKASPLHDLGKVGIADAILLKPGRLSAEEFEQMKGHTRIGAEAIDRAIAQASAAFDADDETLADDAFEFLLVGREIALGHHEKWDGSGYPTGLAGDAIPASARLMALADVFDALMSKRVYKPAFPLHETRALIEAGRGQHFDPAVVDVFIERIDEFAQIAQRFADPD